MHNTSHLVLSGDQLWLVLIGSIVPVGAYVVNTFLPKASEAVKAGVHIVLAAIAGALYTAVSTSTFGWNTNTLELVATAVVAALVSHHVLWKPSGISQRLRQAPARPVIAGDHQ